MPNINIVHWNIEEFGRIQTAHRLKTNYTNRCSFIAHTALNVQADVICVTEIMGGHDNYKNQLVTLQTQLNLAFNESNGPRGNWYYDHIGGSLNKGQVSTTTSAGIKVRKTYQLFEEEDKIKFSGSQKLQTEGYAVFWNQNLAKFSMQRPPKVRAFNLDTGAFGADQGDNTQSVGVQTYQKSGSGSYQKHKLKYNVQPLDNSGVTYTLPKGTKVGDKDITTQSGATIKAGTITDADESIANGITIPVKTQIGKDGITVQYKEDSTTYTVIVVPGHYTLTNAFVLPAAKNIIIPKHCLSLVMEGRRTTPISPKGQKEHSVQPPKTQENYWDVKSAENFDLGGTNNWVQLPFAANGFTKSSGIFEAALLSTRRPAFCTLKVNDGTSGTLFPVLMFHTPNRVARVGSKKSPYGNRLASYSRPLYQAYDHDISDYTPQSPGMIGGDFNLDFYKPYLARLASDFSITNYTNGYSAGGANCEILLSDSNTSNGDPFKSSVTKLSNKASSLNTTSPKELRSSQNDNVCYTNDATILNPNPFYKFEYGSIDYGYVYDLLMAVVDFNQDYSSGGSTTDDQKFSPLVGNLGDAAARTAFKANFPQIPVTVLGKFETTDKEENFDNNTKEKANPVGLVKGRYFKDRNSVTLTGAGGATIGNVDLSAAAQAANFIKKYISDHLPVVAPMDFSTPPKSQNKYDLSMVALAATSTTISAGNTTEITLTLKDTDGNKVENPYVTVLFKTEDTGQFLNPIDGNPKKAIAFRDNVEEGVYSTTFETSASDGPETAKITAFINGRLFPQSVSITIRGIPDASKSKITPPSNSTIALGKTATIYVRLMNSANRLITHDDSANINATVTGSGTTNSPSYSNTSNNYEIVYTAPVSMPADTTETVKISVSGTLIETVTFTLTT